MTDSSDQAERTGQLRGWKEIARRFGVDERTVKRWETSRALPVHRVPGAPRAPVYAYASELAAWMAFQATEEPTAGPEIASTSRQLADRKWWGMVTMAVAVALLALGTLVLRKPAAPSQTQSADHVRRLAGSSLSELNARLEQQPRTVRLRAALAEEAASALKDLASQPAATPELRREAAMAYRRLAVINSANDRPSLLDRAGARAALADALNLVAGDNSVAGRGLRATLLIDSARHAAADGALGPAQEMLQDAAALLDGPAADLGTRQEWRLAASEIAQWRGEYQRAISFVQDASLASDEGDDPAGAFRLLRAIDLSSEAKFYAGDVAGALAGYNRAARLAARGAARWPGDIRWTWYVGREDWNVGSTLGEMGRGREAVAVLSKALEHWEALSRGDPEDESVMTYVRAVRVSYGGALKAAGRPADAARVLSVAVGETREWLARRPDAYERQRAMVVRLSALGDALAAAQRPDDACAAYGEAASHLRTINGAGKLSKLDHDSLVRTLRANATPACPTLRV